jgi:O-acetyl-ADP-ribose deacetylase
MAIKILKTDITKIKVDAIINAVGQSGKKEGDLKNAIFQAAGPELLEYLNKLGELKTTEVIISPGFNLPAQYIIHAVIPNYIDGNQHEQLQLHKTYKNVLDLALKHGVKSIAFSLVPANKYGFSKKLAINVAINAIQEHLENHEIKAMLVIDNSEMLSHFKNSNHKDLLKYIEYNYFHPNHDFSMQENCEKLHCYDEIIPLIKDVAPTIDDIDETFCEKLIFWMNKKNITNDQLWKKANIDRKLFSKIYCGGNPSKKTAILLTLALELNLDDSLDLLSRAGYTLSNAFKEDIVVRWHIIHQIYSVFEVCESLILLKLPSLQ